MEATVDVDHRAGRRREPVGQQRDRRAGDGRGVLDVPAERERIREETLAAMDPDDAEAYRLRG